MVALTVRIFKRLQCVCTTSWSLDQSAHRLTDIKNIAILENLNIFRWKNIICTNLWHAFFCLPQQKQASLIKGNKRNLPLTWPRHFRSPQLLRQHNDAWPPSILQSASTSHSWSRPFGQIGGGGGGSGHLPTLPARYKTIHYSLRAGWNLLADFIIPVKPFLLEDLLLLLFVTVI